MLYAARTVHLRFIVNVVLNSNKEVIASFAGDLERAHLKGCEFLTGLAQAKKVNADITVSTNGGYPLDQNIYQAVKGMVSAEATNKEGGVILMVAGLADGTGGRPLDRKSKWRMGGRRSEYRFDRLNAWLH